MTISVIIPTLNEEQSIQATLSRVHSPAFSEVLIADGGSQDQTRIRAAAVAPWAQVIPAPRGRARQMNTAAAAASADVLLFLHADTLLPSTAGEELLAALQDPLTIGGRFDVRLDRETGLFGLISTLMNWRSRLTGIATGDQALFVRRSVFRQLGGFPDIPIMEDIAFSQQLKQAGRMAALHSHVVTSGRRWERQGTIRTILLMWILRFLFFCGVAPQRLKQWFPDTR
jgi:rSAM/selenodomain-associated transferase 2